MLWVWILTLWVSPLDALSCWAINGTRPVIEECPSHLPHCFASYHVNLQGETRFGLFGCNALYASCNKARCEPTIDNLGGIVCCCNHNGCNAINSLSDFPYHTPEPPPFPSVTPPPVRPGYLLCEVYNCSRSSNCYHGYQNCDGYCSASYQRDVRGNYALKTLECLSSSPMGISITPPDSCFLDTSGSHAVIRCQCGRSFCNSIPALNFSSSRNIIHYVDRECKRFGCDHICVRRSDGAAQCLCQPGYILDQDNRTCIDFDECSARPNYCEYRCINTAGSYMCTCPPSQRLLSDGRTCEQPTGLVCASRINCSLDDYECLRPDYCSIPSEVCVNFYTKDEITGRIQFQLASCLTEESPHCGTDTCVIRQHPNSARYLFCCCSGSNFCNANPVLGPIPLLTTATMEPMTTLGDDVSTELTFMPVTTSSLGLTDNIKENNTAVIGIVVAALVFILSIMLVILCCCCYMKYQKKCKENPLVPMETDIELVSCHSQLNPDTVTLFEIVGNGKFACVRRGTSSGYSSSLAVKIFHPHAQESFQKELWIYSLPEFQHPNILDFVSSRNDSLGMWIITTFHEHGSLSKILTRSDPLTWEQCISLVYSFASGLAFLHNECGRKPAIAHRDLKTSNVLVKNSWEVCISDFGLSSALPYESDRSGVSQVGTPRYMAPELIDLEMDIAVDTALRHMDLYASGLVIWEVASRTCPPHFNISDIPPYQAPYEEYLGSKQPPSIEAMKNLFMRDSRLRPTIPPRFATNHDYEDFVKIIEDLWHSNPGTRISATCLLERVQPLKTSRDDSGIEGMGHHADGHSPLDVKPRTSNAFSDLSTTV